MKDLAQSQLTQLVEELEKDASASPADIANRLTQAAQHIREAISLLQETSDHE
jgi:hypothetical protein